MFVEFLFPIGGGGVSYVILPMDFSSVTYVCQARVIQTMEVVTISVCTRQPVSRHHACVHSVMYGGQTAHVEPVSCVHRLLPLYKGD